MEGPASGMTAHAWPPVASRRMPEDPRPPTPDTPSPYLSPHAARELRYANPVFARWRSAACDRGADARTGARGPVPDPPRRHGLGQDDDGRQRHPGLRPSDPGALAQQDARGAALRRTQELLPAQRRRVFHLLLRLLPTGGVYPLHGYLHRERRLDQRGHRPPAAARDVEPHGARGRHHRLDRIGDLRVGRAGRGPRADGHPGAWSAHRAR